MINPIYILVFILLPVIILGFICGAIAESCRVGFDLWKRYSMHMSEFL